MSDEFQSEQSPAPRLVSRRTLGGVFGAAAIASAISVAGAASPASAATVVTNVSTVAALKAAAITTPSEPVFVLGYYAAGDGGGGIFFWDISAGAAVDGGTVIASNVSSAGAWRRLSDDTDQISPRWFGCKCDGTTDDSANFQAALRASVRLQRQIELPGATIRLASPITLGTGSGTRRVMMTGNGPHESQLLLTDTGRLDLDLGSTDEYASGQLVMRDFSIRCATNPNTAAGVTALKARFGRVTGTTPLAGVIENIEISGISDTTGPKIAMQIIDSQALRITGVRVAGRKEKPRQTGTIGILLQGDSIPVEMFINETKAYFFDTGFLVDGESSHHLEGINFDRCAVVAGNYGLVATAPGSPSTPSTEPGLWITVNNSTMNCAVACVVVRNWINIKIAGNLFYGDIASPTNTFDAISIYGGHQTAVGSLSLITDNIIQFTGAVSYQRNGIAIEGNAAEDSMIISNNLIAFFSTGIILYSGASRVAVAETNIFRSNTVDVSNLGSNNVVKPALETWT